MTFENLLLEIYLQVPFTELHNLIWLLANADSNMKACYLFTYCNILHFF